MMIESKSLKFLAILCLLITGCVTQSQPVTPQEVPSNGVSATPSKQALAKAVLSELGIAKKYDLYLGNSVDITASTSSGENTKFLAWLQSLLVQEAGWKTVEAQYITQLTTNFSEAELKELLSLAKQPLMKKLLESEVQAYTKTGKDRRVLLFKVWDDYNSGKFIPPPEVLK